MHRREFVATMGTAAAVLSATQAFTVPSKCGASRIDASREIQSSRGGDQSLRFQGRGVHAALPRHVEHEGCEHGRLYERDLSDDGRMRRVAEDAGSRQLVLRSRSCQGHCAGVRGLSEGMREISGCGGMQGVRQLLQDLRRGMSQDWGLGRPPSAHSPAPGGLCNCSKSCACWSAIDAINDALAERSKAFRELFPRIAQPTFKRAFLLLRTNSCVSLW